MIRRIGFAAVLWIFLGAGAASAALQPPITVLGTQWLQPVDFLNYSWNSFASVCDATNGMCNGSLGGNDLTGWTWASVDDVNALFNHYIVQSGYNGLLGPGPDGEGVYYSGLDWVGFMEADGFLPTQASGDARWISGLLRTNVPPIYFYVGSVFSYPANSSFPPSYDAAETTPAGDKDYIWNNYGAWFYQGDLSTISVPITDTLALVGLGLCALGFTSRKRPLL